MFTHTGLHSLIMLNSVMGVPHSVRMLYNNGLLTALHNIFLKFVNVLYAVLLHSIFSPESN
jgi:hypothetical protein